MTQPGDSQARTRLGKVWFLDKVRFNHWELTVQSLWGGEEEGAKEDDEHKQHRELEGGRIQDDATKSLTEAECFSLIKNKQ